MKLKTLIVKNFRAYKQEIRIEVGDLTAFIGKNEAGKSSILEALEIFFNSEIIRIEGKDCCVFSGANRIEVGCAFIDVPKTVVLDETAITTLKGEHLLAPDGSLEIHKIFD